MRKLGDTVTTEVGTCGQEIRPGGGWATVVPS
jgi:hypothetical protein